MRYYIIAGERSGDLHGGNLVKALKRNDADAVFRGFGGDYMRDAGVDLTVHYSEIALMGFAEILTSFQKLSKLIRLCKNDILQFRPEVIVLIDYGGFNGRIAAFGKQNNIKVFYYITPKVWAWYQRRALTLKKNVDRMFVILPFEKDFFNKFDWKVDYVGNPVLDEIKSHIPGGRFLEANGLQNAKTIIALLPGSRRQEVEMVIPVMEKVVRRFPGYQFAVAAVNNLDQGLYQSLSGLPNVTLVPEDTYNLLLHSRAAIVTSGTATLETALFKVPQVVVYKTSPLSYRIAKMLIKVPFISLVNLIRGKEVIKEMIQQKANVNNVSEELNRLVSDEVYRAGILEQYDIILQTLDTGSASENTANLMVKYLNEEKNNPEATQP